MSYTPSWRPGDWKAICDRCGLAYKASQLKRTWDGLMVCEDDWEPRHPQDFIPSKPDQQAPPWTRPEGDDVFVTSVTIGDQNPMDGTPVSGASNSSTNANFIAVTYTNVNYEYYNAIGNTFTNANFIIHINVSA